MCKLFDQQALECLVRLASVRRSIFVEDPARSQFLSHLMAGTKEILQTGQGLPCLKFFMVKLVFHNSVVPLTIFRDNRSILFRLRKKNKNSLD